MGKRKRTSRRTGIVDRAVKAGRRAFKEAESRIPPDLRRQLQKRLKDADKNARAAIKQLQAQVQRASTRADVNSLLKRIDGLTRQARQIAGSRGTTARAAATRKPATAARRTASRPKKAPARRAATTPKPAATRAAAPRKGRAPRRTRRAAAAPEPTIVEVPVTEVAEVDVYEIREP